MKRENQDGKNAFQVQIDTLNGIPVMANNIHALAKSLGAENHGKNIVQKAIEKAFFYIETPQSASEGLLHKKKIWMIYYSHALFKRGGVRY